MEKEIKIRSLFYGWRTIKYEDALDWAKWHVRAITTTKSLDESLVITNSRLEGIQFSLCDLMG